MKYIEPPYYLFGTTVVVIRTPSELVIGADSIFTAKRTTDSFSGYNCKITQMGNLFFSAAGFIGDSHGKFNVHQIALDACENNRTAADTVNAFEKSIQSPLLTALEKTRAKGLDIPKEGTSALETVFVGLEHGIPFFHISHFTMKHGENLSLKVGRINCPGKFPNGMGVSALGHRQHIDIYLSHHGNEIHFPSVDKVALVRQLIQIAIDGDTTGEVGGPVVILQLHRDGPQWIQNDGLCPDLILPVKKEKKGKTKKKKGRR